MRSEERKTGKGRVVTSRRRVDRRAVVRAAPFVGAKACQVVMFGGSFDPVHRWHLAVVKAAQRSVERQTGAPAWVLLVPAARSPHKRVEDGPRAGEADRVEMLERAAAGLTRTVVWTDELDRAARSRARGGAGAAAAPSYTVETLRRLRKKLPRGSKVWLLIGADQAEKFHLWREYRAVMRMAEVLVVLRPPRKSVVSLLRAMRTSGAWSEPELEAWRARVVRCGVKAVSSTQVRAAARGGRGVRSGRALRRLVTAPVAEWIEQRGLYQEEAAPGGEAR